MKRKATKLRARAKRRAVLENQVARELRGHGLTVHRAAVRFDGGNANELSSTP